MNARFWIWENDGPVKLTLKPGQELSWGKRGRHEEGWSSEFRQWKWDGTFLWEDAGSDGTDCDGRMSHSWNGRCHAFNLRQKPVVEPDSQAKWVEGFGFVEKYLPGMFFPAWETIQQGQRDYSAEAMGY